MTGPKLTFNLSARSADDLEAVGRRLGRALGCTFAPHHDQQYDRGEALSAAVLGLRVIVSHDPDAPAGEPRDYVVTAWLREDLDAEWDIDAPVVDLSDTLFGVLRLADPDAGWSPAGDDA